MASSFLKKKAREREALVDKEHGANAYGGSDWRKNRDEDTPGNEVNNAPGGGNAAGSNETGRKASSFLQKKAAERASVVDKQHGEDSYGGSKWMDTQLSADGKADDDDQGWWERIKDAASTAYDRVYGKDDEQASNRKDMPKTIGDRMSPDAISSRIDELTKRQSELVPLISGARRGGMTEERKRFEAEQRANSEEIKRLQDEIDWWGTTGYQEEAERLYNEATNGLSALEKKRASGQTISEEMETKQTSIAQMEKELQELKSSFDQSPSEALANQYNQAAARYQQTIDEFNALYAEYEPLAAAVDAYNNYIDLYGERIGKGREADWKDITWNSLKQGYYNSLYGEESFAKMLGSKNDADAYKDLLAGEDYRFHTDSAAGQAVSGMMNQIGQLYRQLSNPQTIATTGASVGTALLAGNAGPQALVPEEALTVPAAAYLGYKTGSAMTNMQIEGGLAYQEMLEMGVSEETARVIGLAVGGANAGLEALQLDELLKGLKVSKSAGLNSATDIIFDVIKRRWPSVANNVAQEVAQEGVTIAGTQLGSKIDKGEWAYDTGEILGRLGDTAVSSTLTFGAMEVPGAAVNVVGNLANNQKLSNIGTDYQAARVDLVAEGLSFAPESEAYQTAQQVKAKMDAGETVTDADLGRVVVANERTMQAEERLAQANTPRKTADSSAPEAVSEVSDKADTQPVRSEAVAEATPVAENDPLMDAAREAVGANASLKQTVPYNVMSESNPVRRAVVAEQKATQKQTGYGEEGMKLFREIAQSNSMDKTELMVRFDTPYQAGLTGLPTKDANLVNDFQIEAYNAGRMDHIARMAKDKQHKLGAVLSEAESGFDHTGAPKSLTQAERNFSDFFLRKMGVAGSWDGKNGKAKYNAFYNSRTGGVTFAQDFGIDPKLMEKLGSEDFMKKVEKLEAERDGSFIFYIAHEVATHVAMNRAPAEMRAFVNAMYNYKQGMETGENLARGKQTFYAKNKVALDTEGAIEEVVADAILDLYQGDVKAFMDAMYRIANGTDEQAKKGARTYKEMLDDFIKKLKAWFRKLTGKENAEARANLEKSISELEQLRDMFEQAISTSMKAVEQARKNPQTVQATGEIKNSIKSLASAAGIEAKRDATGKVIFTVDGEVVSEITEAHIRENSGLGGLITTAMDNGFISDAEAEIQYKAAAEIMNMIITTQDPEMVWAWVGSSMFSAIKSNADGQYGTTIDFTTVCRKTQDMITAMSKAMMKLKRGLTKDEVTKLQANLIAEGSSVPCPVCYVFSRWAGIGSVLDNMYRWQEKYDSYTNAQLNRQIAELTEKLGKGKAKDLAKMLREQDEEYDNLSFEKEKLALEKKQLTSKKKTAVKNNDARTLVDVNNRIAEIDKRTPQINKRLKAIKDSVAPELAWLLQVRAQPDYETHGKVRANVLFNLDDAATFAEEFPLAWKYRTSRGPSAGKAILPYSDMRLGDMILGVDKTSADGNTAFSKVTGQFTDEQKAYVEKAIARTKAQNLIGGQRFQSTSDFRYDYALDYLMAFWEAQAIGSKMQTYTKIVEFGDMVAAVGGDFNLSVMPRNKGYITLPNGKNQLVFSSVTGIDFEAAKRSSQMHDNGQLILVGINDQHILAALEDSEETRGAHIGFVIPYHASGASINEFIRVLVSNLGETYMAKSYQDYSDVQSDKERSNATADQKRRNDLRTKLLRGKDGGKNWEPSAEDLAFIRGESKSIVGRPFAELRAIERKALRGDKAAIAEYESWTAGALWGLYNKMWVDGGAEYGVRLNTAQAKSVMPHEYWNKTVNRDQAYINGFLFRSYCYNLGLTPRFSGAVVKGEKHGDFTDSKGYWKTLIDRPMYNNDGTYRNQQLVNMSKFNKEMLKPGYAKEHWEGYAVQEPDVQKATTAAEKFVEGVQYSMKVTNKDTLDFLNEQIARGEYDPVKNPNGGYIKVYRSFQVIDGKLYAPMNAVDRDADGKNHRLGYNSQYKVWEMATESPEIAQRYMDAHPGERYAKFNLDGVDNATSGVAYNPYLHASNLVLNDQFSAAYRRNLITVECWVPVSEIGAYKAQYAKDATGWVEWKPGGVAGKLMKVKPEYTRKLFVSRYMLPVREVESPEVAAMYKEYLDGTDIKVPWNVVTPELRRELVKVGVPIDYKDIKAGKKDGKSNIIRFEDVFPDEKTAAQQDDGEVKFALKNVNGKQVVWVENSTLTNKQLKDRSAVAAYIAQHIGEVYTIIESGQRVYIGKDLPGEYTRSKYSTFLYENKGSLYSAKGRAANELGLLIETATNRRWESTKHSRSKDAKYGMYRYDSSFAFPVKDRAGNVTNVRAYDVELLIRNASDGKKYLYDIVGIKENTTSASDLLNRETRLATYKAAQRGSASRPSVAPQEDSVKGSEQYSLKDSQGRKLSEGQQEYFKDSKARDENGNLLVMYHGTSKSGFTVFDTYGSNFGLFGVGSYFTADKTVAESYTKKGKGDNPGIYEVYLNITEPLDMDDYTELETWKEAFRRADLDVSYLAGAVTNEDVFRALKNNLADDGYLRYEAEEIVTDMIIAMGYDGITHIGGGRYGSKDGPRHRVFIAFDAEQIKRVDNLNPTNNLDIRYSVKVTAEEDAAYMDAYFDGDDDLMQEMVDKAAQKTGYTYKAYHHTENAFTVFDRSKARSSMDIQGFFFSADPDAEREYGSARYDVYLKMTNPYIVDSRETQKAIPFDMSRGNAGIEAREWLQNNGYDGVIRKAEYFGAEADEYIVFEPNQIKSADAATFEDDEYGEGEVIPLSARFNDANDDIRYSLKGEQAMRKEIKRIRTEGAKAGKSEAEIENDIMAVVGPEYGELIKTYGEIKRGERAAREIEVPRKTEEGRHVSQTIRTVLEAEATPDAAVPTIEQLIAQGDFSYDVITDKAAMAGAKKVIRTKGYETALAEWVSDVKEGKVSKANTAIGWELYNAAAEAGDLKTAMTILDGMVKHQRNAAQAVQATRILKKLSPDAQLYGVKRSVDNLKEDLIERYGKKAPDLEINEDLARKLLTAKTDEERDAAMREIYQDIGRQIPASFVDKWNAWRYLAMLGNPRTHVRNIVGNFGFAPVVAAKDLTATLIESVVGFVSRGKMGRTKALPSRALLKAAWDDYANAADQITGGGKYNDAANKNQAIEEGRVIFKTKPLEKARKANSAALELEDMWFAKPHYAFALAQYCKAHGVTADQLRRGKALGNARAYAIKEAQKATYRDTNAFSETISELGRYHGDNKVKKGVSMVTEGILPFRKTPANILMRGLEYSPMGLLKGLTWDLVKVKKGDITAADAIDNIAAGLTGTCLLVFGLWAAAEGLIRGAGGDDEEEKKYEELQGHQSYALELPDGTSVTLDWLSPEALPVFIGVNLYEMARDNKGKSNLADILTAVSNVTEPLLEMSCLQSLNDLFDSVGYATTGGLSALPSALASAATSYLTQAFPTILGQAERSAQDVRMTTYTEKDNFLTSDLQYTLGKISARLPGWDFQQIPYVDAWGRTESTGSRGENAANNFLNPAYMSEIETSAMEEELQRLYDVTGEKGVLPDRAAKKFTVNKEDKHLTAEEYVQYATERGQMAYDLLTDLTSRSEYQNASDAEKVDAVERAYEYATAIAKTKVSDYEPVGWVAKALKAEKFSGMSETEYMLYKLALDMVDQPNENGELGTYTAEEKSAAIASRRGLSNAGIAAIWDTDDGYDLYDNGIDMRSYVEYVGTGGSVSAEKLIDIHSKGIEEETYFDFLDKLKEVDQPTESGKMGSYTQDEAKAAVAAIPGLSRAERAALWQSVNKNWKAKNNPWR